MYHISIKRQILRLSNDINNIKILSSFLKEITRSRLTQNLEPVRDAGTFPTLGTVIDP